MYILNEAYNIIDDKYPELKIGIIPVNSKLIMNHIEFVFLQQ